MLRFRRYIHLHRNKIEFPGQLISFMNDIWNNCSVTWSCPFSFLLRTNWGVLLVFIYLLLMVMRMSGCTHRALRPGTLWNNPSYFKRGCVSVTTLNPCNRISYFTLIASDWHHIGEPYIKSKPGENAAEHASLSSHLIYLWGPGGNSYLSRAEDRYQVWYLSLSLAWVFLKVSPELHLSTLADKNIAPILCH